MRLRIRNLPDSLPAGVPPALHGLAVSTPCAPVDREIVGRLAHHAFT